MHYYLGADVARDNCKKASMEKVTLEIANVLF